MNVCSVWIKKPLHILLNKFDSEQLADPLRAAGFGDTRAKVLIAFLHNEGMSNP